MGTAKIANSLTDVAIYQGENVLTRELIKELLDGDDRETLALLRPEADKVRRKWVGDAVHLRGIIEFSNYCSRNCAYCGINRHSQELRRYRMAPEAIIKIAQKAAGIGFRTVVLQSGEDFYYTAEVLAGVVREIKRTGMAVTLSVGERSPREYQVWREAGADRYLLKFETSHYGLYAWLHPGSSLEKRLGCLKELKRLGYQLGSGIIVGLPGQTMEMLADDLHLMRSLELEMAGIGPFIPHPGTPLGGFPAGSVTLGLKVLALARLLLPWAHLPATTALGSLHQDGWRLGLQGGANVLMPNLTPQEFRSLYEIYPQKKEVAGTPEQLYASLKQLVEQTGRQVATDHGHGLLGEIRTGKGPDPA